MLVPDETTTGGEESLVCIRADKYAFQYICILLCGNTITTFCLDGSPAAVEGNLVAVVIVQGDVLNFQICGTTLSALNLQVLYDGRIDKIGHTSLHTFLGAIHEIEVQHVTFLFDGYQTFQLHILGCGLQLFRIKGNGQTDGVVSGQQSAVQLECLTGLSQRFGVECLT